MQSSDRLCSVIYFISNKKSRINDCWLLCAYDITLVAVNTYIISLATEGHIRLAF
jgi:hypothetical protein